MPKLTPDMLAQQVTPPNNCRVHMFRETLDEQSRKVLDEALSYHHHDMPASRLRDLLLNAGFPVETVPTDEQIQRHRSGRGACRCPR